MKTYEEYDVYCPYCNNQAELVQGYEIFPDYPEHHKKWYYVCWPCRSRVGCFPESHRPLGTLATPHLRQLRQIAHNALDPLWRNRKRNRKNVYLALAKLMEITPKDCHIGLFNEKQCRKVVELCLNKKV